MYSVRRPFCLTLRPLFCFQLAGLYRAGLLDEAERSAAGVTAKGIRALRLMSDGYTAREIGEQMGASANNVTAWVSRARRYLREIGRYCI